MSMQCDSSIFNTACAELQKLQSLGGRIVYFPMEGKHQCYDGSHNPISDFIDCPLTAIKQAISHIESKS